MATQIEPPKVVEGEMVKFTHADHEWEEPAAPACEINEPNSGHWYCVVHTDHEMSFGTLDWRDGCRAVWICHTHGPEVP